MSAEYLRETAAEHSAENGLRIWPPADWCSAINPERTHICDQPRGHTGDHRGPELPTVEIDEPVGDSDA